MSSTPRVAVAALWLVVVACSSAPPTPSGGEPTPSAGGPSASAVPTSSTVAPAPSGSTLGARVDVRPAAALLSEVGATRRLDAQAFDEAGTPVGGTPTWTSSHPDVVAVSTDGTLSARAFGSSQVTAVIDGVVSAPVLVLVATPAAGAILVSDEQIVGTPIPNPDGATYQVTLDGLKPQIGDVLVGTGGKPLGGRVAAVDGQTATIELVPIAQLVTDLQLNEVIDLSRTPVQIPAEISRLYDVKRSGNTFEFIAKPNFMDLIGGLPSQSTGQPIAAVGGMFGVGTPVGTYALLPFQQCESSLPSLPFTLSEPPGFSVEIGPTLDVLYTPDDELVHWLVRAEPKATLRLSLSINAQFEAKVACKETFFEFPAPFGGFLSWLIGGVVPVGFGFEFGGKVVVATATAGGKVEATAKLALGLTCPEDSDDCSLEHSLTDTNADPQWTFSLPSVGNVRLEPSLEINAFADAVLSPLLRLEMAKAKVGGKFAASWSPRISQMTDANYRSTYGFTLEGGVSVGNSLSGIAEKLGLSEIAAAELKISIDLYRAPTAKLTTDKTSYQDGETVVARVHFEPPDNLRVLGLFYNVEKVLLVSYTGGDATTLGTETILSTQTPADGQVDFDFSFAANGPLSSADLYAFVVPKYLSPIDELALELERAISTAHLGFLYNGAAWAVKPDGSGGEALTLGGSPPPTPLSVSSPSGKRFAYVSGASLYVADAGGGNAHRVGEAPSRSIELGFLTLAWSPDESRIAYVAGDPGSLVIVGIDGGGVSVIAPGNPQTIGFAAAAWSPDGSRIAVEHFGAIEVFDVGNTSPVAITQPPIECDPNTCASYFSPAWSPDASKIAALVVEPGAAQTRIATMNADGSGITPITDDIGGAVRVTPMSWSADGIAFTRLSLETSAYSVWAVDADGSNVRQLTAPQASIPAPYWFSK